MEAKRAMGMRSAGVLAILCLAICAMLGFAKPAQAAELKPGTYEVNAQLMQAKNPQLPSMASGSLVTPVKVTVDKAGEYTATVTLRGLTMNIPGIPAVTAYASGIKYFNGKDYVDAKVLNYQPAPNAAYPKDLSFPLVNKEKGDDETGFVKIQTVNSRGGSQLYAEDAYLNIEWGTAKRISSPIPTVTSNGVSYAISGKNATVTSISKTAKSATVKSTVKIGGKTYKVTSIKTKAAYNAKSLKKVTLQGKNLKSVGKQAFKGIAKKATVTCPKSKLKAYKKLVKAAGAPSSTIYKAA